MMQTVMCAYNLYNITKKSNASRGLTIFYEVFDRKGYESSR